MRFVFAACAAVTPLCAAADVQAQADEPIVIGSGDRLTGLRFDYVHFATEFLYQRVVDTSNPARGKRIRDTEDLIRETLELSTKGYVGNRNLLSFDITGSARLSQEFLQSDSLNRNERTNENLSDFDATLLFFGESKLPVTLFARRNQILFNRTFGGTLDSSITDFGARLFFQSDVLPNRVEYFHRNQLQQDPFGNTDFDLSQDTISWQGQYRPSPGNLLNWIYTLDIVDENGGLRAANSFTRQDGVLTHTLDFGKSNRNNLRSDIRFFDETGNFAFQRFRWNEILRLRHTPSLETRYEYIFDRQQRDDLTQTLNRGSARFEHQLYQSLRTIGEVGGSNIDSSDGNFSSQEWFGRLDMEYDKIVPYGRFNATLDLNVNWRNDSSRGGDVLITNEQDSFGQLGIVTLSQRNINTDSIVLTDANGLRTFDEGIDYTVRQFADRVEIRLIPGGNISPSDVALVDYNFTPDPANSTLTHSFGGSVRYTLDEGPLRGLSPFVRYFEQEQTRDSDGSELLPEADIEDFMFGMDYDRRNLSLLIEHEIRNSSLSPFRLTRFEGQYTRRIGRWQTLAINARFEDTDHVDDGFRTQIGAVSGRWSGRIMDKLRGNLILLVRQERDTSGPDSLAFEQRLNLTWRMNQTEIFASIRNALVQGDVTDSLSQVFLIGIRREF